MENKTNILEQINEHNKNYAPEQIGNMEQLLTWILEFVDYVETPEMKRLEKLDAKAYETHLDHRFSEFSQKYWATFKILIESKNREENLYKVIDMVTRLRNVQLGKSTMDNEYGEFTEDLNKEYIYSKFGGKEKFTKKIEDRHKNQK